MAILDHVVQSVKQDYALLCKEIIAIKAGLAAFSEAYRMLCPNPRKRSAGSQAKMVAAQKARWVKAQGNVVVMPK